MLQRPRETRCMGLAGRFLFRIRVSDADLLSQVVLLYANDLTNLATVKDWPWVVTVVDLLWGGILATSVSYPGFLAGKWLQ